MPDSPPPGRNRGFALLWAAEALATLGDKVLFVALAWLVLNLTGSSLAMGGLLLCFSLPGIAFLVMGGVASDRLPRRAVMVSADLLRGLLALALAFVAYGGRAVLAHLFALTATLGLANAFYSPAVGALVPDLVPGPALLRANSLLEAARSGMQLLGPIAGGALIAAWGPPPAFFLNGVLLVAAAGLLLLVAGRGELFSREAAGGGQAGVGAQVREGLACLLRDGRLMWLCGLNMVVSFGLVGPLDAVLPRLARESLGAGPAGFGILTSAVGLGALASSLGLSAAGGRLRRRGLLVLLCVAAMGLGLAGLPWVGGVAAGAAVLVVLGLGLVLFKVILVTFGQTLVEERLRGRVFSLVLLGGMAVSAVAYLAFGALADALTPALAYVLGGATAALCALGALGVPGLRRLD